MDTLVERAHLSLSTDEIDLAHIVNELSAQRNVWRARHPSLTSQGARKLPSKAAIERIIANLKAALFPGRLGQFSGDHSGENFYVGHLLNEALVALLEQLEIEQSYFAQFSSASVYDELIPAKTVLKLFAEQLPSVRALIDADVEAAYRGDPAAHYVDEILVSYPGIIAITHHRLAHILYQSGSRIIARIISEIAHSLTGIDIHPGATIGSEFFIDHGTGVVIGETAIIGDRVRLYQAVTLGSRSFPSDDKGNLRKDLPRHPILEDDVVVYAGATILGRVTVGKNSVIGGNVWLLKSVPPNSKIYQAQTRFGDEIQFGEGI